MNQQTRNRLFKFACIPVRILILVLLILFAKYDTFRYVAAGLCFLVANTFTTKYLSKDMVGAFGGFAWWHNNRLKHAFLYALTGVFLILGYEWAGYVLILDVAIGLYSYNLKDSKHEIDDYRAFMESFK